ncbi:MAG: response regulator [Rhodobacteraceae bacterium]|nr:response regulator [Paracoccaceae bacterium]MBL6789954.1 response regulator [Paracoccaceae bacterium]
MAWITRWGLEDDLLGIMVVSDPLALRYVNLLAVLSVFIILIIQYSAVGTISKSYSRYLYEANKKASAANLAKTRFLANMSHEIRTPMNEIMGVLELFEAKQLDHEQARLIKVMRDSSAVLLRLVDEILDSSKVEAGRVALNLEPTALLELFENIVEGILPFAQSRNVEFSLNFDPQLPQRIDVDPGRLRQIILNLLTNAIKFSTPSLAGKTGAVSLCLTRDEKDHLLIVVSDNGIGIDVKNHQDIFEPFLQVESGAGLDFGGTGLGLSVVYQLVSKMNGTIKVDSMKGSGATFEITLPMVNPEGSVNIPCLESEQVLCLHQPGKPPRAFERYVRATGAIWHSFDQPSGLLGFLKTTASPPFIVIANSGLGDLQKDQLFRDIAMHDPDLPVVTFASRAHPDFKKIFSGRRVLARRPMLPSEVWCAFSEMHSAQLSRTQSGLQKIKPITPTQGPVQTQILLIDQNEVSRLILKHQLEKLGCVVAEAAHFQDALLVLRDKAFDLILIDAVLIEASSQSVIVEIRALQSERHETQMALIAVGRSASATATVLQGVDAQLKKPVSTLELAQVVDRWRGPIDPNAQ